LAIFTIEIINPDIRGSKKIHVIKIEHMLICIIYIFLLSNLYKIIIRGAYEYFK